MCISSVAPSPSFMSSPWQRIALMMGATPSSLSINHSSGFSATSSFTDLEVHAHWKHFLLFILSFLEVLPYWHPPPANETPYNLSHGWCLMLSLSHLWWLVHSGLSPCPLISEGRFPSWYLHAQYPDLWVLSRTHNISYGYSQFLIMKVQILWMVYSSWAGFLWCLAKVHPLPYAPSLLVVRWGHMTQAGQWAAGGRDVPHFQAKAWKSQSNSPAIPPPAQWQRRSCADLGEP